MKWRASGDFVLSPSLSFQVFSLLFFSLLAKIQMSGSQRRSSFAGFIPCL